MVRPMQIDPRNIATRVVYDKKLGRIVHVHQVITIPGASPADETALDKRAHVSACTASGCKAGELAVLRVRGDELQVGAQYKVDVKARRLVPLKARTSSPRRRPK